MRLHTHIYKFSKSTHIYNKHIHIHIYITNLPYFFFSFFSIHFSLLISFAFSFACICVFVNVRGFHPQTTYENLFQYFCVGVDYTNKLLFSHLICQNVNKSTSQHTHIHSHTHDTYMHGSLNFMQPFTSFYLFQF